MSFFSGIAHALGEVGEVVGRLAGAGAQGALSGGPQGGLQAVIGKGAQLATKKKKKKKSSAADVPSGASPQLGSFPTSTGQSTPWGYMGSPYAVVQGGNTPEAWGGFARNPDPIPAARAVAPPEGAPPPGDNPFGGMDMTMVLIIVGAVLLVFIAFRGK